MKNAGKFSQANYLDFANKQDRYMTTKRAMNEKVYPGTQGCVLNKKVPQEEQKKSSLSDIMKKFGCTFPQAKEMKEILEQDALNKKLIAKNELEMGSIMK